MLHNLEPFNCAEMNEVLNRIISVKQQYFKPLNCVQIKLLVCAILETTPQFANK